MLLRTGTAALAGVAQWAEPRPWIQTLSGRVPWRRAPPPAGGVRGRPGRGLKDSASTKGR